MQTLSYKPILWGWVRS